MAVRRYTSDWQHDTTLRDGSRARFRWLRPDDAPRLREGYEHLSAETVRMRFHGARGPLRDKELRYLTEVDQESHLAICAGALEPGEQGEWVEGRGLGVARSVRLVDEPGVAEAAVVVSDDAQRLGVGRRLLGHLAGAALERGISTFRCEVMEENTGVRALLSSLSPAVTVRDATEIDSFDDRALVDGHQQAEEARVLVIEVPLSREWLHGKGFSGSALAVLFRMMATRALAPVYRLLGRYHSG